jgi:hypothetical protein
VSTATNAIIIVRSLTNSDLGLFAAHRVAATSKQRAININAPAAKRLINEVLFEARSAKLTVTCVFGKHRETAERTLYRTQRNWRLGGPNIATTDYALLDAKDFVLIRSPEHNDGSHPVILTFVSKKTDRVLHAGVAAVIERHLKNSTAILDQTSPIYSDIVKFCADKTPGPAAAKPTPVAEPPIPPMPRDVTSTKPRKPRTIHEKVRSPHMLERMLQVAGDLSAPAQHRFMETVELLAQDLRAVLLHTGQIIRLEKDHKTLWKSVSGKPVGFVDGGLASLSMLGSAPIAARVGGYTVTPGIHDETREQFTHLKFLIDELYTYDDGNSVFSDSFPDVGALRDAARISVEAGGAVQLVSDRPDLAWLMLHGSLVNPVSRYTDVMRDGQVRNRFPDFSAAHLKDLLPEPDCRRKGRDRNFISVYLRQLELLQRAEAVVCGVVERESTTSIVCRAVLDNLKNADIADVIAQPPDEWKRDFRQAVDPLYDDESEGQRITDSLLFRCVLEPGEALIPVPLDRNERRRAPRAWQDVIARYPKPWVSYMQVTEWSPPVRIEIFEKDVPRFKETAKLVFHCALLLPRYAFPVGLDIVDKFAKVPNWMSRPVNTHTAVVALKQALDSGDTRLFNGLRRMLCGSSRDFLLRPGILG